MSIAGGSVESRRATRTDVERVADIFAHAFAADPVMRWMARSDASLHGGLRRLFGFAIATSGIDPGETRYLSDGSAATLWTPPGAWREVPPVGPLLGSLHRLAGMARGFQVRRLLAMEPMLRKHPATPHWYLFAVGVRPERQGQRLGGALLRETLARVDASGAPAYLENSNPKNTRLYERLGFETIDTYRAGPEAPEVLLMWRPARASAR